MLKDDNYIFKNKQDRWWGISYRSRHLTYAKQSHLLASVKLIFCGLSPFYKIEVISYMVSLPWDSMLYQWYIMFCWRQKWLFTWFNVLSFLIVLYLTVSVLCFAKLFCSLYQSFIVTQCYNPQVRVRVFPSGSSRSRFIEDTFEIKFSSVLLQ